MTVQLLEFIGRTPHNEDNIEPINRYYMLFVNKALKYILSSVDIEPQIVPEEDELMDFENISEVWNNFKIDGKDMKYILEHSVLFLST